MSLFPSVKQGSIWFHLLALKFEPTTVVDIGILVFAWLPEDHHECTIKTWVDYIYEVGILCEWKCLTKVFLFINFKEILSVSL